MKFTSALVVLAVAVTASSAQQFGYFGFNPYFGAYPARYGFAPSAYFAGPAAAAAFAYDPDAEFIPGAGPAFPAAIPVAPASPFASSYVAANRGSVHVAPLEGHAQSVRSINTDPAPGTF